MSTFLSTEHQYKAYVAVVCLKVFLGIIANQTLVIVSQ